MGIQDACARFCYTCVRVLYWLPIVFVLVIVLWAYYVYVYVLNLSGQFSKHYLVSGVLLVISHIILVLHLSSYFRTIFQRHKPVPQMFLLSDDQLDQLDDMVDTQPYLREIVSQMPVHQVTKSGGVRYCSHCEHIKPDRCHHCSTCDNCILKMDHHCPWVNNCVGFSNYKFFFLFLTYTIILCLWFCLTGVYDLIHVWSGEFDEHIASKFNITFCFIIVTVFGLSTSGLFFFHFYLVFVNKTTIENMDPPRTERGKESNLYYLGVKRNLQAVFGKRIWLAFLPIQTSEGNGASFPIHGSMNVGYLMSSSNGGTRSNHVNDQDGLVIVDKGGSESEVEIYAVDDQMQETHLLAAT